MWKNLWADGERWHVRCQNDTADCYKITTASPLALRRAVWLLAFYFKRELGYDFVQYGDRGHDDDPKHVAFLWLGEERIRLARGGGVASDRIAVGACCFRWREWREADPAFALQWVWFHPFARRCGFLADCWPAFCGLFSPFHVEGPLSSAMRGFLAKMGTHCERGIPTVRDLPADQGQRTAVYGYLDQSYAIKNGEEET
jgi:hypothetical protein